VSQSQPLRPDQLEIDAGFRESRIQSLMSVSPNTFWAMAIMVLAFGMWDYFADEAHWRRAFGVRLVGSLLVVASGVYQKLPGRARSLPSMVKLRLVIAVVTVLIAASMLDGGFGYNVAGLVVIFLTGPYIAIDSRDLLTTNFSAVAALGIVLVALPLEPFDKVGTAVFVALAVAVSTLLGRVLEASNRRAFMLELEQHRDARTDALTGLANRRSIDERGRIELKMARRTRTPVSVLLCDLDHFKSINDRYGHEVGDAALVGTAEVLRNALRESDALGRWGGEEFIAVLPATAERGAVEVAERMRQSIAAKRFPGLESGATISVGVASSGDFTDPLLEWDLLLKEADQRLYRAKRDGRNRVMAQAADDRVSPPTKIKG